jgi:crotonobetainyl-CoA:carnitine CoA-transferase CaiB-like acyl-CoA transferase
VALSGSMQSMAEKIFRTIGRPDLVDDPRFRTNDDRLVNRDALDTIIGEFISRRSREDNLSLFEAAGVTVGPVNSVAELIGHPYVTGREIMVEMDDAAGPLPMHNVVTRLSATPGSIHRGAPAIGQDTEAILAELRETGREKAGAGVAG